MGERGIAGSEVVDGQLVPEIVQGVQDSDDRALLVLLSEVVAVEIRVAPYAGVRQIYVGQPPSGQLVHLPAVPLDPGARPKRQLARDGNDGDLPGTVERDAS